MNNNDDRFSIIPGIVDTDTYPMNINFPYVLNGDKYQTLDTVLKKVFLPSAYLLKEKHGK